MTRAEVKKLILATVDAEIAAILAPGYPYEAGDRRQAADARHRYRNAQNAIVEYAPAKWLGRPLTNAESRTFGRAMLDLEREGRIKRFADAGRATHIGRIADE
jgi:hypothetical protein